MKIHMMTDEELITDKLIEKRKKLSILLKNIDEKLATGEIDKDHHKQLYEKYNREIENLDNKIKKLKSDVTEIDMLRDIGLESEIIQDTVVSEKIYDKKEYSGTRSIGGTIFIIGLLLTLVGYIAPNLQADLFNIDFPYSLGEADKFCKTSLGEIGKGISIEARNACGNISAITGGVTVILIIGIGLMVYGVVEKLKS